MNKTVLALSFACALGAASAGLRADAVSASDTVALRDGRVLHGEVIEESQSKVVLQVDGVNRTISRDLIKSVAYGSGPSGDEAAAPQAPGPGDAPQGPDAVPAPQGHDLVQDISLRYRVPERDVVWVREQGIPDADLSLVFLVAATAQVMPRAVVKLRLAGWSWADIETHYNMNAQYIYYEPGPWGAYPYYYPAAYWGWGWGGGWWGGGWRGGYGGGWGHGGGHWR